MKYILFCLAFTLTFSQDISVTRIDGRPISGNQGPGFSISDHSIQITDEGAHQVQVTNLKGEAIFSQTSYGKRKYSLSYPGTGNVYMVTIRTEQGKFAKKIIRF
jgi:hypothetical protein